LLFEPVGQGAARRASRNDAPFLEAEIAAAAGSRHPDDDVIDQMNLQDSAGFENSPSKTHVSFRRRRITRYAACGITGAMPYSVLCRTEHSVPRKRRRLMRHKNGLERGDNILDGRLEVGVSWPALKYRANRPSPWRRPPLSVSLLLSDYPAVSQN
jgi:hypothetical protein